MFIIMKFTTPTGIRTLISAVKTKHANHDTIGPNRDVCGSIGFGGGFGMDSDRALRATFIGRYVLARLFCARAVVYVRVSVCCVYMRVCSVCVCCAWCAR